MPATLRSVAASFGVATAAAKFGGPTRGHRPPAAALLPSPWGRPGSCCCRRLRRRRTQSILIAATASPTISPPSAPFRLAGQLLPPFLTLASGLINAWERQAEPYERPGPLTPLEGVSSRPRLFRPVAIPAEFESADGRSDDGSAWLKLENRCMAGGPFRKLHLELVVGSDVQARLPHPPLHPPPSPPSFAIYIYNWLSLHL